MAIKLAWLNESERKKNGVKATNEHFDDETPFLSLLKTAFLDRFGNRKIMCMENKWFEMCSFGKSPKISMQSNFRTFLDVNFLWYFPSCDSFLIYETIFFTIQLKCWPFSWIKSKHVLIKPTEFNLNRVKSVHQNISSTAAHRNKCKYKRKHNRGDRFRLKVVNSSQSCCIAVSSTKKTRTQFNWAIWNNWNACIRILMVLLKSICRPFEIE